MSTEHPPARGSTVASASSMRGRTVHLLFCVAAGAVFCLASVLGGHPWVGVVSFAILVSYGSGAYVWAGRSETAAGMFDRRDERWSAIDVRATAVSGLAVLLTVLVLAMWEAAHGRSGAPYTGLAAVGGLTYLAAFLVFSARS